jgi:hypothetical protein
MLEYEKYIESIKKSNGSNRVDEIFGLWRYMGDDIGLSQDCRIIIGDYMLSIYQDLEFYEKHAAIQVIMKAGDWSNEREIVFDYFGEVFSRFKIDAELLSNYLCVLEGLDNWKAKQEREFWDLTTAFRDAYERLKAGNSKHLN